MSTADLIADLIKAGVAPELVGRVAAAIADAAKPASADDAAERRRAWDREYRRQKRESGGKSGGQTEPQHPEMSGGNRVEIHPTSAAPRARGEDNPLRLVTTGGTDVEETREADDWPEDRVRRHFEILVEAVASPQLDPSKSPDLVTTAGRLAAWRRDGASWRNDVLPVVAGLCAKSRSRIASWKFFDAAIGRSIAENRACLEIPESAGLLRSTGPPMSFSERANAAQEIAVRRILESSE